MAFEDSAGLNVHNHYGPRSSGGVEGVTKTEGYKNEFVINLPLVGLDYKFPIRNNVKVTGVDVTFATGTVTAVTIGGVAVLAATEAAPVTFTSTNTGVVAQVGGTGGYLIIKYTNLAGDEYAL